MASISIPFQKLLQRGRELSLLGATGGLLGWDQETLLPPKSHGFRAEQSAQIAGIAHHLATTPEVGEWLSACENAKPAFDGPVAACLVRWRRDYNRATRIPVKLVEENERASGLARSVWARARKDNHFASFAPHLEKLLSYARQMADLWGYSEQPYDALLEGYEPGWTTLQIETLFAKLQPRLMDIAQKAFALPSMPSRKNLAGHYPRAGQEKFLQSLLPKIGFDLTAGRLDTSTHPFCSGLGPYDTRMTTRYDESDFMVSLYGVLHEAGHGLYDQGLPETEMGTPLGQAASLGIHESQSRLWENRVGRSHSFWKAWWPELIRAFPSLTRYSWEQGWLAANAVERSFIRVEADEVTYDLHILLRFQLETRLVSGDLKVCDLPAAWNELFQKLLGLEVPDDAKGCLQDIHWSLGGFGYFPTYTLGNLAGSQLWQAARQSLPELAVSLESRDYHPLLQWLRNSIHAHGRRYLAGDLIQRATGKPLDPQAHLSILEQKVKDLSA
ncbi:MAG: carboxypeptidase M32 [Verrucomicrobia bacterium]|nr:carboxypeptidase M32 [Verrucomicrobiota bacterium]